MDSDKTFRNSVLSLAMLVVPALAAEPSSTNERLPDQVSTRLETPSADLVPLEAYNEALAQKPGSYYCEARTCDAAPALLVARAPVYPAGALREGTEGRASVVFDIDATGMPQNLSVESATTAVFGVAALEAVRNWRFRPATLGGRPVKYERVLQVFPFELQD
jgi:TonB family protein